jgi:hypothetical protein
MTSKNLTRNHFLKLSAGVVGMSTLPFGFGCPADDTGDEGAESGNATSEGADTGMTTASETTAAAGGCEMDPGVTIAANHGHALEVPLADVVAAADVTYDIQGTSGHTHSVTLTADQFAMLQEGTPVAVTSTVGDGHSHEVTVDCG